jgi:hypothetical protein
MLNRRIKIAATLLLLVVPLAIWTMAAVNHKPLSQAMLVTTIILFVAGMFNLFRLRN